MEVDGQAGGSSEVIKNLSKDRSGDKVPLTENKGVIGVLENRARTGGVERVMKPSVACATRTSR